MAKARQASRTKASSPTKRSGAVASPYMKSLVAVKKMQRPNHMRVMAICNQKGGCGKTTSVINIAAGLALMGQRVLVIDLDSQANATTGLGVNLDELEFSTYDLMTDKKMTVEDVIIETDIEGLHIAPANIDLSEFESKVAAEIGRENRLKKAIAPLAGHYDFVLIDTPPSLGLLSINALNAANEVHIALQAQPFAYDGLNLLLESISMIKEEINPSLNIRGIIVTMFDPRTKISHEIVEKVLKIPEIKSHVFKSVIHQNVKLTEASRMRKPVMFYNAQCTGTEDYIKLCQEICKQNVEKVSQSKSTTKTKSATR